MPPPGTITLVDDKPHNRGTWAPHGQKGWYVSPAMIQFRCLTSYIPKTASERVSDTTEVFPAQKIFPSLSPAYAVTSAAADLRDDLQNPTPSRPVPYIGENQTTDLRQLAAIFNTAVPQAPAHPNDKLLRAEKPEPP